MGTNQRPADCIVSLTHGVFTININSSCYVQKPWIGDYRDTPAMETFRKVVWDVFKNGQKHGEIQIYCAVHHSLSHIEYITKDAEIYSLAHYKHSDLPHTELQRAIFIAIVTGFSTDAKTLNELGVKLQKLLNGRAESNAKEQPKETSNQKKSYIDYTIQVICDSIVPRVFWGSEGYVLTYHIIPKEAYGAVPPHYLNNARIRIHRGQDGWTIFAECINGIEMDEGESFKLVGLDTECEDLVELARIYTVAWNKNFHEQYSNALKYLPHLQYLQHLQQNTQSCSTD